MNEFERIHQLLAPLAAEHSISFGLDDDVALLSAGRMVVTSDTIVRGVHYIGDEPAGLIAKKLLRCNLSDLAAKGATPKYYTLNMTLSEAEDDAWLAAFAQGLGEDQEAYGIQLIGGDSTQTKAGPCVLSVTAFGEIEEGAALPLRANPQIGDVVCMSGTIGDAAIGLKLLQDTSLRVAEDDIAYLIKRYQLPVPRVALGQALLPYMHASMDISDGLIQDAEHIAKCSNVAMDLYADKLPLSPALQTLLSDKKITLQNIAACGDDYEILCTMSEENAASFSAQLTVIGQVKKGSGVRLLDASGNPITLPQKGYIHGTT